MIAALVMSNVLFGCMAHGNSVSGVVPDRRASNRYVSLTWSDYIPFWGDDDPETAGYILDGKTIGKGKTGFTRFLDFLERLPNKGPRKVFVFPDMSAPKPADVELRHWTSVGGFIAEPSNQEWIKENRYPVPFHWDKALMKRLDRIADKKGLEIIYLPRSPAYYEKHCPEALRSRHSVDPK